MPDDSAKDSWAIQPHLRTFFAICGVFCVFLVVYASIVPLEYTPLSWEQSIERWRSIPWLDLGIWERADWIANTLIFIPPTFFMSGYLCTSRRVSALGNLCIWLVLMAGLAMLVLAIELIQIWFPPRTVSWNDVAAGILGVFIGGTTWLLMGRWLGFWITNLLLQQQMSTKVAQLTIAAMLAFVLYSIYPFDFVFSLAELEEKRNVGRLRVWTDVSMLGWVGMVQSWGVAALRLFPFGVWLGWKVRVYWALPLLILLAFIFEAVQIPVFSKHAAGDEVVAGIMGGIVGWWLVAYFAVWSKVLERPATWMLFATLWALFIPGVFLGGFEGVVSDPQALAERWRGMLTPPLARYYYTSEYSALSNLGGKLAIFGIFGLCIAGYSKSRLRVSGNFAALMGFLITSILGLFIEVAQVYLSPFVADLTDVAIYLIGYTMGVVAGLWFFNGEITTIGSEKRLVGIS